MYKWGVYPKQTCVLFFTSSLLGHLNLAISAQNNQSQKLVVDEDGDIPRLMLDLEDGTLKRDDKDEFVRFLDSLIINKECVDEEYLLAGIRCAISSTDARNCAAAILSGQTGDFFNADSLLSADGHSFLHTTARFCNPRITSLLLDTGYDPNFRSDVDIWPVVLKHALPLNLSLHNIPSDHWEGRVSVRKSAIMLITSLFGYKCCHTTTLGLLANKTSTEEINNEFFKFVKQGKVVEVAALLLVASDRILSSQGAGHGCNIIMEMHQFLLDQIRSLSANDNRLFEMKETVKFLEIFGTIGDKLLAVSQIRNKPRVYDITLGIASLIQDAGFHVTAADAYDSETIRCGEWWPFRSMLERSFNGSSPKIFKTEMLPSWLSVDGFCYVPDNDGYTFDRYYPRPLPREASLVPSVPARGLWFAKNASFIGSVVKKLRSLR